MDVTTSMAAVAAADMERSADFYGRLFGCDPHSEPMPGLAEWHLPNGSGLQVVLDAERAGRSLATLVTPDLDRLVAGFRDRGLETGPVVEGALSRFMQVGDPDGNLITLVEQPGANVPL